MHIVEINHYTDTVRLCNYCVKCGKWYEVKFSYSCMFGEVDAEIKRRLSEKRRCGMKFTVIDNKTGKCPDLEEIATEEEWAQGLMYCDMEGFALLEDGILILCDECGRFEYCPDGRFTVVFEEGGE